VTRAEEREKAREARDERLLVDVFLTIGSVPIVEQRLIPESVSEQRKGVVVYGGQDGRRIYVNPDLHKRRDHVLSTLLHEGIHLARPQWKEQSVERAEKRLLDLLTEDQASALYAYYQRTRRPRKGESEF
jgi:hypothetical protein